MRLARWALIVAGGLLLTLLIVAALGSRSPVLRQKLVQTLQEKLDADVELQDIHATAFPSLTITGEGLRVRLKGQRESAPLIEVRHFEVTAGLMGMFHRPRRFHFVRLEGLRITIPPRSSPDRESGKAGRRANVSGPVIIEQLESKDAELVIVPSNPDKSPRVFAIHDLEHASRSASNRAMPFTATLTNPIPVGEIKASGSFGPWMRPIPGHARRRQVRVHARGPRHDQGHRRHPVVDRRVRRPARSHRRAWDDAPRRISASTSAASPCRSTPPFTRSSTAPTAIPISSRSTRSFSTTKLTANGGVYGHKGVKGRTVQLDVTMNNGSSGGRAAARGEERQAGDDWVAGL